ncbi:transporter substrate-binding domain-containing protein [Ruania albidiflava]|uniref:transporter substrate-binding domain-containing protein n=1 Tax=Ruania albidiflava TaxID=366586 RepID=UPI000A007B2D|nr:transporter substrate-binding domain-containing protein [Ruania albidiflava]
MANSIRRTAGVTATAAAVALGLAACGAAQEAGGDGDGNLLEQLQEQGSITVAFAGEIPYSWETEDGELTGATIALDREIYAAMGIDNVEGQYVDWDALIPGLNKGEYDSVSAGMSILPDRCAQASFSDPALMYTTGLMVPEGNPMGLSDLQSVIDSDAQLAVQSGTIEQGYADDLGIDNPEVVQSSQDGMAAVSSGRVDAFALTAISLRSMAEDNPDSGVEVTEAFVAEIDGVPQVSAGATVFRDENTDLLEAYNEQLDAIVSDPERFEEVVGEFGFTEAERPAEGLTTEMFCEGTDEDLQEAAEIQESK